MVDTNSVHGCTDIFNGDKPLPMLIMMGSKKKNHIFDFTVHDGQEALLWTTTN